MKKILLFVFVAIIAVLGFDIVVNAEGVVTPGPSVALDVPKGAPGETVWATITGFESSWVTISICGNNGHRGSPDCNMLASDGAEIVDGAPLVRQVTIVAPPVPCPCIVRVADRTNSVVASAALVVVGHPTGEVSEDQSQATGISVSVHAESAGSTPMAWLRRELGGSAEYEVTVTVRNTSSVSLSGLRLSGSAGRDATSDLMQLPLENPGVLGAGETWEQTLRATAPAPSFDDIEWRVFVSGAGPTVTARQVTNTAPSLLVAALVVLVAIIGTLFMRMRVRSHQRLADAAAV